MRRQPLKVGVVIKTRNAERAPDGSALRAEGQCLCGDVAFEIEVPAVWAWHDHSSAGRRAHGGAYATYVGTWRSRLRITRGEAGISRFEDPATAAARSFCARCGTPLFYERARAPKIVNIPRGLFSGRVGREPRYHIAIDQLCDWAYRFEPLVPLKGFPGVVWARPRRRKRGGEIPSGGDEL